VCQLSWGRRPAVRRPAQRVRSGSAQDHPHDAARGGGAPRQAADARHRRGPEKDAAARPDPGQAGHLEPVHPLPLGGAQAVAAGAAKRVGTATPPEGGGGCALPLVGAGLGALSGVREGGMGGGTDRRRRATRDRLVAWGRRRGRARGWRWSGGLVEQRKGELDTNAGGD